MIHLVLLTTLLLDTQVWPTTVAGWVGLAGSALALAGTFWGLHRHGVLRARKEADDEARMKRLEERLDALATRLEERFSEFRAAVTGQMNGFGGRLDRIDTDAQGDRVVVNGILQSMATVTADMRHLDDSSSEIKATLQEIQRDIKALALGRGQA